MVPSQRQPFPVVNNDEDLEQVRKQSFLLIYQEHYLNLKRLVD